MLASENLLNVSSTSNGHYESSIFRQESTTSARANIVNVNNNNNDFNCYNTECNSSYKISNNLNNALNTSYDSLKEQKLQQQQQQQQQQQKTRVVHLNNILIKNNCNKVNGNSLELNAKNNNNNMNNHTINLIPSQPLKDNESFIRAAIDEIIKTAVYQGTDRNNKVVEWHAPEELRKLLDLKLNNESIPQEKLLQLLRQIIRYSVKTGHPYFVNQLYSCLDPYALVGQWLTDSLNPSVYTFEVAPVFTLMEEEVLKEMRKIVGFPNGNGDGIFCPGGSIANGYAISLARFKYAALTKQSGLFNTKPMIIFTSEDAHYSVEKLAMFMGFGSEHVCKVASNACGKMDLQILESRIQHYMERGCRPLMVSATAGTTVLGAFDDLQGIAGLCQKYDMWMHTDAAWGGGALVSSKYRQLLRGIEKSDSVTWNPHKLLAASQQCSTLLTRDCDLLKQCHSTNAAYLFQKDKFYDTSFDTGDKHIQCGRRADVLKFWFMWKAKGTNGLEAHVDRVFQMSEYFTKLLQNRKGFELVVSKPECTNITFWYVPPSLRNLERDSEEFKQRLHTVAPKIKERMIKKGSMMITYQPLRQLPNFFRLVLQNSSLNETDMEYFLNEIETLGSDL